MARSSLSDFRDIIEGAGLRSCGVLTSPLLVLLLFALFSAPHSASNSSPERRGAQPSVLLLTIDTMAARNMSVYGYERPTTPNLQKFAQDSICFESAHSTSNTTNTSIPAYEGFYYGAREDALTLQALLKNSGYRDTLWVSFHDPKFFGLQEMDQSRIVYSFEVSVIYKLLNKVFEERDLTWMSALLTEEWPYFVAFDPRVGAEYHQYWTREHFSEEKSLRIVLEHLKASSEPTFVWVHLWQPHYPYLPNPPHLGAFDSDPLVYPPLINSTYRPEAQEQVDLQQRRYDEYLLDLDSAVGRFLEEMRSEGELDNTVIVIGSDHGESFEKGWIGHGGPWLDEALIHIPLMIRLPRGPRGVRPVTFASPLDLAPTLLEYLELEIPAELQGESLWPYIHDPQARSPVPKLSVSYFGYTQETGEAAVFSDRFKLIFAKESPDDIEVYQLDQDPDERENIVSRFAQQARAVVKSVKVFEKLP
ncbi:MAG: sulfatase [Vulcanimicrobiota bacterium]